MHPVALKSSRLPRFVLVFSLFWGCTAAPEGDDDEVVVAGAGGKRVSGTNPTPNNAGGSAVGGNGSPGGNAGSNAGGSTAAPSPDGGTRPTGMGGSSGPAPDGGTTVTPDPAQMVNYNAPPVVISEIMYHAVGELTDVDEHEFIEIANRSAGPVEIGNWKIDGEVKFSFPAKLTLAKGQHLVIAKTPAKLTAVWKLADGSVLGPYMGALDNGGGRVALLDAAGMIVEEVRYKDDAPWPMGGDAFGVGESWWPAGLAPEMKHQFKGYSIERLSYEVSPAEPVNWTTSKLDASTPGAPYGAMGMFQAIVVQQAALPGGMRKVQAAPMEAITVSAVFSARGTLKSPEVEYFVDDPESETEPRLKVAMTAGAEGTYQAVIPGQPEMSVVRYRIRGDRGDGMSAVIGPRPTDPYAWYGVFAAADRPGKAPTFDIFINRAKWAQLYTNIQAGRVTGCTPNPTWNNKVPATLVYQGRVIDVQARYQGSPYNRTGGPKIAAWPTGKWPAAPAAGDMKALSWHLSLPRYAPIDGSRDVILNKRANECGFLTTNVGGRLFETVGIPSTKVTFARAYVNGTYYHYMSKFEHPDEDMLTRFFGKDHVIGDWFKVTGWNGQQGPYTWADGRDLDPSMMMCKQFTKEQLYTYNFDRASKDWKTNSNEVAELVKSFQAAKAAGPAALKKHFTEVWDYESQLNYMAMVNWMIPWDDFFQNHFLYRKADGKWTMTPWDFDLMMGGFTSDEDGKAVPPIRGAQGSFYIGELGNHSNRVVGEKWNNFFKDAFIKTFRTELQAKWKALATKELAPAAVEKFITETVANYNQAEAAASASKAACSPQGMIDRIKKFAVDRNARIAAGLFD